MKQFLYLLFYSSICTLAYWFFLKQPYAGIDDANIYFTYAKNLAEGHGLVYNVGGEKVEGFTSILWMLVCTLAYLLSPEKLVLILTGINVVLISVLLHFLLKYLKRLNTNDTLKSNHLIFLFFGLLFLTPGWFEWNVLSVMESGLWALLLFLVFYELNNYITNPKTSFRNLAILTPILLLTRPESMAWILAIALALVLLNWIQNKALKRSLLHSSVILFIACLTIATITFWRLQTFGYPLPNTYYAKVSSDLIYNLWNGFEYFIWFLLKARISVLLVLLIPVALFYLFNKWRTKLSFSTNDLYQLIICYFILVGILIPFPTGGDHFQMTRFYQPIMIVILCFFLHFDFWSKVFPKFFSVLNFENKLRTNYTIFSILFFTYFALTPIPFYQAGFLKDTLKSDFSYPEKSWKLSEDLESFFEPLENLPYITRQAVGGIGYAYNGKVLDMYGLNDTEMAHYDKRKYGIKNHAAFSPEVFLVKKPDITYFSFQTNITCLPNPGCAQVNQEENWVDSLKGLFQNEDFKKLYSWVALSREGYNEKLVGFYSNVFLETLSKDFRIELLE